MKKLIAALMTVLFLGSTGLVLADTAAPSTTPVAKTMKHKKVKKVKKVKKTKEAAPAAPASK